MAYLAKTTGFQCKGTLPTGVCFVNDEDRVRSALTIRARFDAVLVSNRQDPGREVTSGVA